MATLVFGSVLFYPRSAIEVCGSLSFILVFLVWIDVSTQVTLYGASFAAAVDAGGGDA